MGHGLSRRSAQDRAPTKSLFAENWTQASELDSALIYNCRKMECWPLTAHSVNTGYERKTESNLLNDVRVCRLDDIAHVDNSEDGIQHELSE